MKNKVLRLTESALLIAMATLLSLVTIIRLPQGGDVTLCSTLPLVLIGYRYGVKWGMAAATFNALIQLLLGLSNLSYAANFGVAVIIVLFDYLIAYAAYGLAGFFKNSKFKQGTALCLSLVVCSAVRYVCHVVSGYFVWSEWAEGEWLTALCEAWGVPAASDLYFLIYSMGYNSFVLVDMAIAMMVAVALSLVLDLSCPGLPRVRRKNA